MEYQDTEQVLAALGGLPARPELEGGYKDTDAAAGKLNKAAVAAALAPHAGGRGKLLEAAGARSGLAARLVLQRVREKLAGLGIEFQVATDQAADHAPSLSILNKIAPKLLELVNRAGRYFDGRKDFPADASVKIKLSSESKQREHDSLQRRPSARRSRPTLGTEGVGLTSK